MPWFSHGYAAEPDGVLDVELRATGPRDDVLARDLPHLRARAAARP